MFCPLHKLSSYMAGSGWFIEEQGKSSRLDKQQTNIWLYHTRKTLQTHPPFF